VVVRAAPSLLSRSPPCGPNAHRVRALSSSAEEEDGGLLTIYARLLRASSGALLVGAVVAAPSDASADRGRPIAALRPVADTYIEAGAKADMDHGESRWLDADASPAGVTYLEFDLSAVTEPIGHARLILSVTNPSDDGGHVYRVHEASWPDGGAAPRASIQGLRWGDVDRNGDGRLDAADGSTLVPEQAPAVARLGRVKARRRIALDVTAAFTDGPGIYTLAIASGSSDGVTFRSREARGGRPLLRLYRAPAPGGRSGCGDGVVGAGEQCEPNVDTACPGRCRADCSCGPVADAPFACLAQDGPLVEVSADADERYSERDLDASTRIDARGAVFHASSANRYPISLAGDGGVCVAGGTVLGQADRNDSWEASHDVNSFGIAWSNPDLVVDGLRVDDVTDGVRPYDGARNFTVRDAWLSYIRDDCIENDHVHGGLIDDSLFDGCYVGIAARPTPGIEAEGYDGRDQVLTITRSLIRLQRMPGPRSGRGSDRGHGVLFKWHDLAPRIALHGNVFLVEEAAFDGSDMGFPDRIESCSDNVLVWLGEGEYPEPLPDCVQLTRDRRAWDDAVAGWHARNPHVGAR
jgi:hypothetical protein